MIIGSTHSVVSPGIVGRLEYINRGGVELKVGGNLWTPWVENTVAVYNNGRSNGLNTELTLPFSHSLILDMNAAVDWRLLLRMHLRLILLKEQISQVVLD